MTKQRVNRRAFRSVALVLAVATAAGACGDDDDAGAEASVSFVSPSDGDSIAGGIEVELAAEGVVVEPAGDVRDGAGHFHVIADAGCVETGEAIPRDVAHLHLGQGQADGVLHLGPGAHELCVQVGDGAHGATDVTETITVEVRIEDQAQWCAVVEEVDVRFEDVDNDADSDFAAKQAGYIGIGRLVDQVIAAIDQVDADVRTDVLAAVERAHDITDAYVDAADFGDAEENLEPIFTGNEPIASPLAAEWILDTCAVDVDG